MRKDPTAFRERFKKWKETGEYELPKFEGGQLPRFAMGTEGGQLQPNIFQRPDGSFFYNTESG